MAGLRTDAVSMRNLPQPTSDFSSWVQSLDESKQGNLNPGDPTHKEFISAILNAVESGQATQEDVNKLARLNKGIAPQLFTSLGNATQKRDVYSRHFQPEQTALPEQSGLTLNVPGGTMETTLPGREARAGKQDYINAIREANSTGNTEMAEKLIAQAKNLGIVSSSDRSEYFQFLPTAKGYAVGDSRRGTISYPENTVIPAQFDPNLKSRIKAGEGYGGKAGTDTAEADVKQHESALSAVDNVKKIDDLINQIESSDAITGMGADILKNIERAKVFVSNSEKAGRKVSDTELLDVMMGAEVFPMIGALGIGARGMDTPAERDFMRQVLTGSLTLNKQTLLKMSKIRRDIALRSIDKFNKRVDKGELDNYFRLTGRQKQKIDIKNKDSAASRSVKQQLLDELRK